MQEREEGGTNKGKKDGWVGRQLRWNGRNEHESSRDKVGTVLYICIYACIPPVSEAQPSKSKPKLLQLQQKPKRKPRELKNARLHEHAVFELASRQRMREIQLNSCSTVRSAKTGHRDLLDMQLSLQ